MSNPYASMTDARKAEEQADVRAAEAAYLKAIAQADRLPLQEYRLDFQQELKQYDQNPAYQSQPGVDKDHLQRAYLELLALPFVTRMQLASFYARHGALPEAQEACNQAFTVSKDMSFDNAAMKDFLTRALQFKHSLTSCVPPTNLVESFQKNFQALDLNGDGFVHEDELTVSQFNLSLDSDCHRLIAYLLRHYLEIEAASQDEFWGVDIKGISNFDVVAHQQDKHANWKRMKKRQ